MSGFAESYAVWLADYYLLATVLLALALTGIALLKQPAQRLAIAKSTLVSLILLAALCAIPGWSAVHLLTEKRPQPVAEFHDEVSTKPVVMAERLRPLVSEAPPMMHEDAAVPVIPESRSEPSFDFHLPWPALFAMTHLGGATCIVLWLVLGWIASARLRRTAQTAPTDLVVVLNQVFGQTNESTRRPQLLTHERIDVAVALGAWRPTILLPGRWIRDESPDHLRTVLTHESTHIVNHDLRWVALARMLFIALWANPLFWMTRRWLRRDQEALADAAAAEFTSRQRYAEQLVAWARDAHSRPALHLSSAVGLWEGPSQLRQRIALLIDEHFVLRRECPRGWRLASYAFCATAALALSLVTIAAEPVNDTRPTSADEVKSADGSSENKSEQKVLVSTDASKPQADPNPQKALFELYRKHFKLPEPNVVGGFVVDEKLQPIAQAKVSVFRTNWRDYTRKLIAEKSTDADGKVRFDQVFDIAKEFPGGKIPPDYGIGEELLQVVVRAPGRVTDSRFQARQLVAKRGEPLMIIMPPATTLRGRVTGPDGKPVAGALVAVGKGSPAAWAEPMTARSDAHGNYVIDDVPPFDLKAQAEQEAAMRSRKDAAMNAFRASPQVLILTVEHPNFAVGKAQIEKTPGTTDIQLQPAAILAGRIVFGDSGKPAGGARVWIAGHHQKLSEFKRDDAGNNDEQRRYAMPFYTASTRADSDGKYRFATLPPGYYHLLAEMPSWVHVGLRDVSAEAGKTTEVSDLTLTKGGTVSIRLVNAKTREPIQVPPEALALIGSSERPIFDRPPIEQRVSANKNGLFELSLPAGEHEIYIGGVYVGADRKWMSDYTKPTESPNAFVTVTDSKSVQVDMPVIDAKSAKVTGAFVRATPSLVDQAAGLRANGKPLEAIKLLNAVLDKDPNNIDALLVRADAWQTAGEDRKAIAEYEHILKLKPSQVRKMIAWNNLAFILAASPDDGARDGKRAVDMAETAKLLQETPTPDVLDTLAAAYAETGQFDRAVKTEQEAIGIAPEIQREEFRKYLKLYEAHKLRRETRATNDQPADKNGGASTSGPKPTEQSAQAATQPGTKQPAAQQAQPAAATPTASAQWPPVNLFRPMKPNSVRGIVADEKRAPIAGAKVSLFRINTGSRDRTLIKSTTAGDNGFFSIENVMDLNKEFPGGKLPPQDDFGGDFLQVFVQAPGRATYSWLQARQHVARWGDVNIATLTPAAPLRGRILGADDKPVAGAAVSVAQSGPSLGFGWNGVLSARTDADGNYTINDLGPFDLQKYRDELEAKRNGRQPQTIESAAEASHYLTPPKLIVEHPDFAVKQTAIEKIPGTTDAKLEPAAILNGSVIYAGSGKPAAGAIVRAGGNRKMFSSSDEVTKSGSFVQVNYRYPFYEATVRTDANGRYKIGSLPAGFYRLWVEMPDWVSDEGGDIPTKPGATHEIFNLELTKGGTLSVRLVDSKTGKPIEVKPGTSAIIGAQPAGGSNRPVSQQTIKANADGRFELQAPPGRQVTYVASVYEGDERIWIGDTGDDSSRQLVTITDGKTTNVDSPVTDPKNAQTTGTFQVAPVEEPAPRTETKPASDQQPPKKGADNSPLPTSAKVSVAIPVIIAKHVMLLNGKEVITWGELDAKIAALPDPSQAYPHFYVTHGVIESGGEKEAKPHMYELHRKFKLKGHSEGTLAARTSLRYDRIRNQADLVPDESLRVGGIVLDSKEQPVAGAEVVLITPVDVSLSYKAYDIALVEGRLRNRLDDVVTDTDAAGRFAIYPPKGKKYCVLVLHPSAGINIAWDQGLATEPKVHLLPWAALISELGPEPGAKQTASLSTQVRAQDGYPEINLAQYWSDLKNEKPTNVFGFTHVPPIWQTSISRDIAEPDGGAMGLNAASVSLLPGESRRIDLGPLSEKQREWLKSLLEESKKRSEGLRQK